MLKHYIKVSDIRLLVTSAVLMYQGDLKFPGPHYSQKVQQSSIAVNDWNSVLLVVLLSRLSSIDSLFDTLSNITRVDNKLRGNEFIYFYNTSLPKLLLYPHV